MTDQPSRTPHATARLESGRSAMGGLGGKGRALAALVAADYPVPKTGVVTVDAYRAAVESPELADLVDQIIDGAVVEADEVTQVFLETEIAESLRDELVELGTWVGAGNPVAVRSSATVEDLAGSSFAGQYRSVLNVDTADPDAIVHAIKQVWASLWFPAPVAYRRAFGIDESNVAMAVVVMQMIPATTAGVVFTVDPGGAGDAARVEAVEGLGESLVSGERTPSAWVVPRNDSTALPSAPRTALELSLSIEQSMDAPQDVEWAAIDDEVYVVQARPITVLDTDDGFDTALDDHELTTAGIVEMVPGVLPALRWDLNRFLLEEAFRSVLDSLGVIQGTEDDDRPFVRRVRGRAAIDFDQLRAAASSIPGAVAELEAQYFGSGTDTPAPQGRRRRLAGLARDARTLRTRRLVVEQAEVLIRTVQTLRSHRPDLGALTDDELLRYASRSTDLAARGLTAELGVAAAGAAAYQRLQLILAAHLDAADAANEVQRLVGRAGAARDPSPHGSAAVFAGPTWEELGGAPTRHPVSPSAEGTDHLAELEHRLTSLPGWTRRRILTGQFVDVRVHLIRRTVAEVIEQLQRREATKAAFLELGGEVRRIYLEVGRRLATRELLPDPTDIELLSSSEIRAACRGEGVVGADAIGRRRNWLTRYEPEGQLPIRFIGEPQRGPASLPEGDHLVGWAASPGRSTGRARVMRSPKDSFERGEVLVAEATDASWSPVFIRASAIVVERGGPLSHAAILARELGLPAVLNIEGATGVLDRHVVLVDGDSGVVVIDPDEESS